MIDEIFNWIGRKKSSYRSLTTESISWHCP